MPTTRSGALSVANAIGWLATAAAVAIVPAILVPAGERSGEFWYRVAWAQFLAAIAWGCTFLFVQRAGTESRGSCGAGSAALVVVFAYITVSLAMMLLAAYLPWESVTRLHLACQAVAFPLATVVVVLLWLAQRSQGPSTAGPGNKEGLE